MLNVNINLKIFRKSDIHPFHVEVTSLSQILSNVLCKQEDLI